MQQMHYRNRAARAGRRGLISALVTAGAAAMLVFGTPGDAAPGRNARGFAAPARPAIGGAATRSGLGARPAIAARPSETTRESGRTAGSEARGPERGRAEDRGRFEDRGSREDHGRAEERGRALERGPAGFGRSAFGAGLARNGLPRRPFPGEVGFSGVPPRGETRFVASEMIVHVGPDVSRDSLDAAARRLGLVAIDQQPLALTGGTLVHFRLAGGVAVPDAIRALEAEKIGIAQPNYVFRLQQDLAAGPMVPRGDLAQYVLTKLQLAEAHRIATGANVPVAVIDSQVDGTHPDIAGSIAAQFDAVGAADMPDEHGTGMTGAIAAHRKLVGVAPRARILTIHAFSSSAQTTQQATSRSIVGGIDWAIEKGARVINMSFAGPYDPILQVALKKAHDKGIVLVAAAGNMGPQSPPLYPAADENVIAVTAVDQNDAVLPQANQGPHIALAAPGVDVLEATPHGGYGLTTGTSVAAAHVSGVAALLIERDPNIDVATLENILFSTAKDLGSPGRDSTFGYGLVDPYRALTYSPDAKVAEGSGGSGRLMPIAVATTAEKLPAAPSTLAPRPVSTLAPGPGLAPGPAATPATSTANPKVSSPPRLSQIAPGPNASPAGTPAAATAAGPATRVAAAPPSGPSTANAPEPDDMQTVLAKTRRACRDEVAGTGARGQDAADQVTRCVTEARLACLKEAGAQKVRASDRRDFLSRCLGDRDRAQTRNQPTR